MASNDTPGAAQALFSTARDDGSIIVSIEPRDIAPLAADEVLIRVEAAPVNPSDMGLLYGVADMASARVDAGAAHPSLRIDVPSALSRAVTGRLGQALPVGNEGAGTVIAAGASDEAQALLGKIVATFGGAMYRSHRTARAVDCLALPNGSTAREGASLTVNPLTAMAMVGTMRRGGYTAICHTAAASNLGQMLVKLCVAEGAPLVNIVRSADQAALLHDIGATHVVDSSQADFMAALTDALAETGATLAFDAIGGGPLAGQILTAMEAAQVKKGAPFSIYGTNVHKQVNIYGALDMGPTTFSRSFGLQWGISGFLLTPYLMSLTAQEVGDMRAFVIAHRNDIFASHYSADIRLADMVRPDVAQAIAAKATGKKYLLNPSA